MKRLITFFALIAVWASSALAHDFEVNGIYYVKNSDGNSVRVSYKGTSSAQYSDEYFGAVTIPPSVKYSGKTYSVTSIGEEAFEFCSEMTSVTIPSSITFIDKAAFYGCSGLTRVEIFDIAAWCKMSFGNWGVTNPLDYAKHLFMNGNEIKDLIIPASVTSINGGTFENCIGLTSITMPNSVTSIGASAFRGCSGLTSVTIGNCVTTIGALAFSGCSGLTSVTIPKTVTSLGEEAFIDCSGLKSIVVESGNKTYDSRNNSNAIIKTSTNELISGCKNTVIPNSVTSIGSYSFYLCSGLTSLTIPNSVTSIGDYAFEGCSGLTSLTIPNSVTSIGDWTFHNCSGLTSVTIPNSVTSIYYSAFYGCSNIQNLTWNAKNCSSMGGMSKSNISTVTIGDGVEILPNNFVENSKITSVTIPNSVTSLGNFAFYGCGGLTSVTIPESVTSIGDNAFSGCSGLTSVTIGSAVTSIGTKAFQNCSGLKSVTNYADTPQSISTLNVFSGVIISSCRLLVKAECVYKYKAVPVWKDFNVHAGVEGVEIDEATKEVEGYYDLNGIRLEEPIHGQVNIVRYKDGSSQKIVVKE